MLLRKTFKAQIVDLRIIKLKKKKTLILCVVLIVVHLCEIKNFFFKIYTHVFIYIYIYIERERERERERENVYDFINIINLECIILK